jgi:hypothetical protein
MSMRGGHHSSGTAPPAESVGAVLGNSVITSAERAEFPLSSNNTPTPSAPRSGKPDLVAAPGEARIAVTQAERVEGEYASLVTSAGTSNAVSPVVGDPPPPGGDVPYGTPELELDLNYVRSGGRIKEVKRFVFQIIYLGPQESHQISHPEKFKPPGAKPAASGGSGVESLGKPAITDLYTKAKYKITELKGNKRTVTFLTQWIVNSPASLAAAKADMLIDRAAAQLSAKDAVASTQFIVIAHGDKDTGKSIPWDDLSTNKSSTDDGGDGGGSTLILLVCGGYRGDPRINDAALKKPQLSTTGDVPQDGTKIREFLLAAAVGGPKGAAEFFNEKMKPMVNERKQAPMRHRK